MTDTLQAPRGWKPPTEPDPPGRSQQISRFLQRPDVRFGQFIGLGTLLFLAFVGLLCLNSHAACA